MNKEDIAGANAGMRVNTKYGAGTVVAFEHYSRIDGGITRYGIKLDNNPFSYEPAYFWHYELQQILAQQLF